jgi:predicted permease
MTEVLIGTAVPILLLMGIGFLSRKFGILKSGDERVLSSYVYYFALPALFLIDIAETAISTQTLTFIFVAIIPLFLIVTVYGLLYTIFKFSRKKFYLFTISTIFGNTAFFGIPFVTFAFPSASTERLASLAAATIGIVAIGVSIALLESYRLKEAPKLSALTQVVKRLGKNPLIISILIGILFSILDMNIPLPLTNFLHMIGRTTSAIAVFMLGTFLYGKRYNKLKEAFALSILRMIFLPAVALCISSFFQLPSMENSVIVLMHAMPVAVSLSILSQRYDFYKETIASLTLISSVSAIIYLNIWLAIL